jgi:hypothetical protein
MYEKKHVLFFVIKSTPCSVFLLKSYVTFSYDCLCMRKKHVQVFVIKSTPCSVFCYYKSYVAFSSDCVCMRKTCSGFCY